MPLALSRLGGAASASRGLLERAYAPVNGVPSAFINNVGPHAVTQRFSRAPAAGRILVVESVQLSVVRRTAPSTPGDVALWVSKRDAGGGQFQAIAQCHMPKVLNAIGDRIAVELAGPWYITGTDTIRVHSVSAGTGGGVDLEFNLGLAAVDE